MNAPKPEEWRPVPSLPGFDVSDFGRVRSWTGRGPVPRLRSLSPDRHGYPGFTVRIEGRKVRLRVHSMVAEAFIGPRPEGLLIRHLDGQPANNIPSNLRYGTASENTCDTKRHGTHYQLRKTHCVQGHPYDAANTYLWTSAAGHVNRRCRVCNRDAVARMKRRKAAS
jgi:hypothetical protein